MSLWTVSLSNAILGMMVDSNRLSSWKSITREEEFCRPISRPWLLFSRYTHCQWVLLSYWFYFLQMPKEEATRLLSQPRHYHFLTKVRNANMFCSHTIRSQDHSRRRKGYESAEKRALTSKRQRTLASKKGAWKLYFETAIKFIIPCHAFVSTPRKEVSSSIRDRFLLLPWLQHAFLFFVRYILEMRVLSIALLVFPSFPCPDHLSCCTVIVILFCDSLWWSSWSSQR